MLVKIPANVTYGSSQRTIDRPEFLKKETQSYHSGIDLDFDSYPVLISGALSPSHLCGPVPVDEIVITEYAPRMSISSLIIFNGDKIEEIVLPQEFVFDGSENVETEMVSIEYDPECEPWRFGMSYDHMENCFRITNYNTNIAGARVSFYAEIEDNREVSFVGKATHDIPLIIKLKECRDDDLVASGEYGEFVLNPLSGVYEPQIPFRFFLSDEEEKIDLYKYLLPCVHSASTRRDFCLAVDKVYAKIGNKTIVQHVDLLIPMYVDAQWRMEFAPSVVQSDAIKFNANYDPSKREVPLSHDSAADIADYIDPIFPPESFSMTLVGEFEFKFDGRYLSARKVGGFMSLSTRNKEHRIIMGEALHGSSPSCSIVGFTLKVKVRKE